jgi:predicted RNase H-like HicB family nuclease
MEQDLKYYLSLRYIIEIFPIPKEDGGGYCASMPYDFGILGIVGDGETIEEALEDLEDCKRRRFEHYIENNIEIPEPDLSIHDKRRQFVRYTKIKDLSSEIYFDDGLDD